MSYNISILRRAQKELAQLPVGTYVQVRDAILALTQDPRPAGCIKLTGRQGWRIRTGDYRVIYQSYAENRWLRTEGRPSASPTKPYVIVSSHTAPQ